MTHPLVSVAIATYNGGRYLSEQLDTIYAQSLAPLEVVVSDDASTDGTQALLERYAEDRGLRFSVNPARVGLVRNFEHAIRGCAGEYIALADQDDLWKPKKIERLVESIGSASLVYCNVHEVLTPNGELRVETAWEPYRRFALRHGSGRPIRHLLAENWVVSHGVLFRRELRDLALPIPLGQPFHDGWLALIAATQQGIRYLDEPLQTYRQHAQSYTFRDPSLRSAGWARRLAGGRFRQSWRATARAQTARITDAIERAPLGADELVFALRLVRYYRAGIAPGHRLQSALVAPRLCRYFHSSSGPLRFTMRPLLAGL